MRKKILVGNWKMNKFSSEAKTFVKEIEEMALVAKENNIIVGVAPTFLSLEAANSNAITPIVAAQNCHFEDSGAFTGEVSVPMLVDLGVKYCLVGHSERRQYFAETNETCNKKILKLFTNNIVPIYCVGETLVEYENGTTKDVIKKQLIEGLANVSATNVENMIIAYEPVWSIGTGKNASSAIAQDICCFVREIIASLYGKEVADKVLIQYGGSVKPNNIKEYLNQTDIDGALVGGASLQVASYIEMIKNLL